MSLYHDVMEALTPLVDAFDQLGIAYYIGGSVSSSLHGMARQSQDVDVIADIQPAQVHALVQALQGDYYVDEQAWQAARIASREILRCPLQASPFLRLCTDLSSKAATSLISSGAGEARGIR